MRQLDVAGHRRPRACPAGQLCGPATMVANPSQPGLMSYQQVTHAWTLGHQHSWGISAFGMTKGGQQQTALACLHWHALRIGNGTYLPALALQSFMRSSFWEGLQAGSIIDASVVGSSPKRRKSGRQPELDIR